jgi:CheY-like chemotaxis protein
MPGINGVELGAKLQKGPKELQEIPLVLMHSAFDEISSDDIKKSGARAKLVKPFDDQQVVDLVEKLCAQDYKDEPKGESTSTWNMDSFVEPEMPDLDDPLKTVKASNETFDIDLTLAESKGEDEEGFIKVSESEKIEELGVPEPHEIADLRAEPRFEIQKPTSEENLSEKEAEKLFDEFNLAENPDGSITFRGGNTPPEFKPKADNKVSTNVEPDQDMGLWSERFYGSNDIIVPELSSLSDESIADAASMEFQKAYSSVEELDGEDVKKITRETIEKMLQKMLPEIAERIIREEIAKIVGK